MCANGECYAEHSAYIAHIMGCGRCYAPNRHYCDTGWDLKLQADARFIVELPSLHDRRRWMQRYRIEIPDRIDELEARVRKMYGERTVG